MDRANPCLPIPRPNEGQHFSTKRYWSAAEALAYPRAQPRSVSSWIGQTHARGRRTQARFRETLP